LGLSAHGYWGNRRYGNHLNLADYFSAVEKGHLPESLVDPLDLRSRLLERVILALRTTEGVPMSWLPVDALDWDRGVAEGIWEIKADMLVLTARGFLQIDGIEEVLARRVGTQAGQ